MTEDLRGLSPTVREHPQTRDGDATEAEAKAEAQRQMDPKSPDDRKPQAFESNQTISQSETRQGGGGVGGYGGRF